jgi:adenylate cyclase
MSSGRPKDGLASLERSIRLDPRGPNSAVRLHQVALCYYFSREYEAAAEAARSAIRSYPGDPLPRRWLAAALGQLGRTEEAKEALGKAISMAPTFFERYAPDRLPWVRPEDHAHILDGWRKAGWRQE